MLGLLLSPRIWAGLAAGLLVAGAWAVLFHGPEQYAAGRRAEAARLEAATNQAITELSNDADRAAFLRRQCLARGGVYDFAGGRCLEGQAE